MSRPSGWRRLLRIREARAADQAERDVEEEIRFHLEERARELMAGEGLRREEAEARARAEFGDMRTSRRTLGRRATRTERLRRFGAWLEGVFADLRYGARQLRRNRGLAAACVLSLGLAIGAATAIFGVAEPILLRPLPYERPDRLVTLWNTYPGWEGHEVLGAFWAHIPLSYPEYRAIREDAVGDGTAREDGVGEDESSVGEGGRALAEVAIFGETTMALTGDGEPRRLRVGRASASFFPLLGARPRLGRGFAPSEEGPGTARVAVLSGALWRDRFGGRPDVLGRSILLDGDPFTVVGVAPEGFRIPRTDPNAGADAAWDLWIPVGADGVPLTEDNHSYEGIARLAPGATSEMARAQVAPVLRGDRPARARGARVEARRRSERGEAAGGLWLLLGAVGLLLAIACANVATLLLGRVARRRREIATRAVLGAGGGRIARLLLSESLILGLLGAVAGLPIAWGGRALLLEVAPPELALPALGVSDLRFLAVGGLLGLATGIAFGLWPALQARRSDLRRALQGAGRAATGADGGSPRAQRALVAAQVGLSLLLLVAAGLLARSLAARLAVDPGFEPEGVTTVRLSLPPRRYPTSTEIAVGLRAILDRASAVPGVTDVSGASAVPFSGRGGSSSFELAGREVGPDAQKPEAVRRAVLPGYFRILRVPVLAGRGFSEADRIDAPRVATVSRAMAERFWPDASPIGGAIVWDEVRWQVVGVVGDIRHEELEAEAKPAFYVPLLQMPEPRGVSMLVRASGDPAGVSAAGLDDGRPRGLAGRLREAVWEADPALPVDEIDSLETMVGRATAGGRFRTLLVAAFGLTALVLAALGAFGVAARSVATRVHELGIRLAIGADGRRLVREVLARELPALAGGLAVGLVAALAAAGLLRRFLFGVEARDPLTYAAAAALLATVGLAATWLAARRATQVEPVRALRVE